MTLTDMRIRYAKPKTKAYKLSDGGGMYLLHVAEAKSVLASTRLAFWLTRVPAQLHRL